MALFCNQGDSMADNKYNKTQQLSEGVYVLEDGNKSWGGEVNHNFELLNTVLAKKILTVKQGNKVLGTFDGRLDSTIEIPEPEFKNYNIKFTMNGEEIGSFNNSEDVVVDIPSTQQFSLTLTQDGANLGTFENTVDTVIDIPKPNAGELTVSVGGEVSGSFKSDKNSNIDLKCAEKEDLEGLFVVPETPSEDSEN